VNLKERMAAELKAARAIAAKADAEQRDLTPDENERAKQHLKAFEAFKAESESILGGFDRDGQVKSALAAIGIPIGDPSISGVGKSAHGARRSYAAKAADQWGERLTKTLEKAGAKALVGGTVDTPSIISEQPVLIDGRPTSILSLIPRRPKLASTDPRANPGNEFSWLEQTARDGRASSVPDGARKPASGASFESKSDRYRVYATITDPLPKRYLDDFRQLVEILKSQLGESLIEALEADVLNGSGEKIEEVVNAQGVVTTAGVDPIRGILQTSGLRVQPFAADVLTTLSNARYTLEDAHVKPTAWVMNSRDYQKLELMRENGTTGPLLFGSGRTSIEQFLGDYPIVTSSLIAQGTALLGDFDQTELIPREDDHLDVDGSGELFKRNQVIFREEGRYGFAVKKPSAFITVDLTA
jgi:HK97 family phage major capsid protein